MIDVRPIAAAVVLLLLSVPAAAQDQPAWSFKERIEIRANYRDSNEQKFALKFPFKPIQLPVGQTVGFMQTVEPGHHTELSVFQLKLDAAYGNWFAARAQVHGQDKYRRNPTPSDKKIDADELWIRFGQKPEFLERPDGTSFFVQLGKAPKMERQPIRVLESYGLAATSFNRFEDIQALFGGTVGRNLYWRFQLSNGNPLFFRDPNALAGDNGEPALRAGPNPDPHFHSGFPILYNAETEGYFFNNDHLQVGEGLGYRWQREDQKLGFDAIAFHYRRTLAQEANLTGTFYGGDIDLLDGTGGFSLPIKGREKEETGARVYTEWHGLTSTAQFTKQLVAGLHREGWEVEAGYQIPIGHAKVEWIQPALRVSGIKNRFKGPKEFPAPSVWWNWKKVDYGVRVGLAHNVDVTIEHAKHSVVAPVKLNLGETLVTLRIRV